jgi:hypothetical protein
LTRKPVLILQLLQICLIHLLLHKHFFGKYLKCLKRLVAVQTLPTIEVDDLFDRDGSGPGTTWNVVSGSGSELNYFGSTTLQVIGKIKTQFSLLISKTQRESEKADEDFASETWE